MSKQLDEANEAIEQVRAQLGDLVSNNSNAAIDLETGYELLHKIKDLSDARDAVAEVEYALSVLDRRGVVYKVWGREDVKKKLAEFPEFKNLSGARINAIVDHVTEGDDWVSMSEVTADDEVKLWGIIQGTAGDHPDWFPPSVLKNL